MGWLLGHYGPDRGPRDRGAGRCILWACDVRVPVGAVTSPCEVDGCCFGALLHFADAKSPVITALREYDLSYITIVYVQTYGFYSDAVKTNRLVVWGTL